MTDPTEPGADAAPPVPPLPPADPGTSQASAPDPLQCPHIQTGAALVAMRPEGQQLEHAIEGAADWVSRNAPNLYTLAQAVTILKGLFHKAP